jgi:hypothetical protein
MFHRSGPVRAGVGRRVWPIPARADDGDRCRRWRERSQADRGFDGEPPLHAGHFGLGMWLWGTPDPHSAPRGRALHADWRAPSTPSSPASSCISNDLIYMGVFGLPGGFWVPGCTKNAPEPQSSRTRAPQDARAPRHAQVPAPPENDLSGPPWPVPRTCLPDRARSCSRSAALIELDHRFDPEPSARGDVVALGMWHWGPSHPPRGPGPALCMRDAGSPGLTRTCRNTNSKYPAAAAPGHAPFMHIGCGLTVSGSCPARTSEVSRCPSMILGS